MEEISHETNKLKQTDMKNLYRNLFIQYQEPSANKIELNQQNLDLLPTDKLTEYSSQFKKNISLVIEQKDIEHKDIKKKPLENVLFESLKKKYPMITEKHITDIIRKLELNTNTETWSRAELRLFVQELRNILTTVPKTEISNIQQKEVSKNQTEDVIDKKQQDSYSKQSKKIEIPHFITIDSNDRNKDTYPNHNEFKVSFLSGSSQVLDNIEPDGGKIQKQYKNVSKFELLSISLPIYSVDGDNTADYPYLLLEIEEINNMIDGTNPTMSKAFCKIELGNHSGKFIHYQPEKGLGVKCFKPVVYMDTLTIKIKKPNGELFNFGTNMNVCHTECFHKHPECQMRSYKKKPSKTVAKIIDPSISLTFKLTVVQPLLESIESRYAI